MSDTRYAPHLTNDTLKIVREYLQTPFLPSNLFLCLDAGRYISDITIYFAEVLNDQAVEADAIHCLNLLDSISVSQNACLNFLRDRQFTSKVAEFFTKLYFINMETWIRGCLLSFIGDLSLQDLIIRLNLKSEKDLCLVTAMWSYMATANNPNGVNSYLNTLLERRQFNAFKFFIERGAICSVNRILPELERHNRFDILETICERRDLLENESSDLFKDLIGVAIHRNNLPLLEKTLCYKQTKGDESRITKFLTDAIARHEVEKIKAAAHYPYFSHDTFNHAIRYAIINLNAELYDKLIHNTLLTHNFSYLKLGNSPLRIIEQIGYIFPDDFIELIQFKSEKARSILFSLYHAITQWDDSTKALESIILDVINYGQIRMSGETYIKHLVNLIVNKFHPQSFHINYRLNITAIFTILLKLEQLELLPSRYLTSTQIAWLLKLCHENDHTDFHSLLTNHRQSLKTSHCLALEDKFIPFAFDLKNHFWEKSIEECIDNLSKIATNSQAIESLFYHCFEIKSLEARLLQQFDLIYQQTNKSILHFLVESHENNSHFIKHFLSHFRSIYATLTDSNGMTPVDIACRAGNIEKLEAILSHNDYQFDIEKKLTPIDHANEIKDPITRVKCLNILFSNSVSAKPYFQNRYQNVTYALHHNKTLTCLFTIEACLPYTTNSDAQFEALRCLDELLHYDSLRNIDDTIRQIAKVNFCAALDAKIISPSSRSDSLKAILKNAYQNLKRLSLSAESKNLYLQAMYFLSFTKSPLLSQAVKLLNQIIAVNSNLPHDFVFAPFNSIDLSETIELPDIDTLKFLIENNFYIIIKHRISHYFNEIVQNQRFDLIYAMFKRKDKSFGNLISSLLSNRSFRLEFQEFINKLLNKKYFEPLLILYETFHLSKHVNFSDFDIINFILKNEANYDGSITHPFLIKYLNSSFISTLLKRAFAKNHQNTIKLIHDARRRQPEGKADLITTTIETEYKAYDLDYSPITIAELHLNDTTHTIENLIRQLPDTALNIPLIMCVFYHSFGYRQREALFREYLLKVKSQQGCVISHLIKDKTYPNILFLKPLITHLFSQADLRLIDYAIEATNFEALYFLTLGKASLDLVKRYIENGGKFPIYNSSGVDVVDYITQLLTQIISEQRYDLIDAMRANGNFTDWHSYFNHQSLTLLNQHIQYLNSNKQFEPLLKLYELFHHVNSTHLNFGDFDVIRILLKKNLRVKKLTDYLAHPFLKKYASSPIISAILKHAMEKNDIEVVELIRRCRYLQQEKNQAIATTSPGNFQTYHYRDLDIELITCFYCSSGHIKEIIQTLQRNKLSPPILLNYVFYHSIGFPEREALLREQIINSQDNIFHDLTQFGIHGIEFLQHLIQYLIPNSQLAYQRNNQGETPIHIAAKNNNIEKLQLLLSSCKQPPGISFANIEPTPLQSLYHNIKHYFFWDNQKDSLETALYLYKHTSYTQHEITTRLASHGIKLNLKLLTDKQITTLIKIDFALFKPPPHALAETIRIEISNLLRRDSSIESQRFAIQLIESLYKHNFYSRYQTLHHFSSSIETFIPDIKTHGLLAKGLHYKDEISHYLLACEALKCFREVAKHCPDAAEEALHLPTAYACVRTNTEKLNLLGHFALTIATISRKKLSRSFICCRSPEKIARNSIDPFIKQVELMMNDTRNPDTQLDNLRQLITSLSYWNPLQKSFHAFAGNELFSHLMGVFPSRPPRLRY